MGAYARMVVYFEIAYFQASTGPTFGSGVCSSGYESGWYYTSRFRQGLPE